MNKERKIVLSNLANRICPLNFYVATHGIKDFTRANKIITEMLNDESIKVSQIRVGKYRVKGYSLVFKSDTNKIK